MFETPIHVIDFEGSRQSGVVEYGYVTLEQGVVVDSQTRVCAPVGTISDLDRVQHGISESRAAGAFRGPGYGRIGDFEFVFSPPSRTWPRSGVKSRENRAL